MATQYGIRNVELSTSLQVQDTVRNLIQFLALENVIEVSGYGCEIKGQIVTITIQSKNQATTAAEFQKAIQALQASLGIWKKR